MITPGENGLAVRFGQSGRTRWPGEVTGARHSGCVAGPARHQDPCSQGLPAVTIAASHPPRQVQYFVEDLHARQVQDIGAYVRGLEAALRSLPADPSVSTSIRRLARSLAHAADLSGVTEVAARARHVHGAGEGDLERVTRDLLAHVEGVLAPPPDHDVEVLLVEDNRTVAATVHGYLKRHARRIHVAASALEAEALLAAHPIDVVVLDLILPDRDGRDLLIQIREDPRTASLPVVVLSAEDNDVARAECLAVGASDFLSKPPDPKALRAAVARQVASARAGRPANDGANRAVARPSAEQPRILLVEDDIVTATLIRHRLERDGLAVSGFANGDDAFQWAEGSDFDLAILDVKVPGMDGFELLDRLRRIPRLAGVPIVMLTGLGGEDDIVRGLELGANDYMVKPFSPAELLARVRRLVRLPEPDLPSLPSGAVAR